MKKRVVLVLVLAMALVFAFGGNVSAKKVVVLTQLPLSGPLGALDEMGWGYIDAMTWFNEEAGGLGGQKIDWHLEDMRYTPTVEVANFNKYCAEYGRDEFLMASGYITGGLKALIEKVNVEEKIPWVDGSFSSEIFGPQGGPDKFPYYYSVGATYEDQIKVLVKWINENHKGTAKARVAFIFSPTAYGRDGTPEGIAYAKKLGLDVIAEIEYPYNATNATSECTLLRKKKAEYVIFHGYTGTQAATSVFFKTVKKVMPKVQLMGTHYMGGRIPILLMGPAFDGFIAASCWPYFDAVPRKATPMDNAYVRLLHDFAKKYRPDAYAKGIKSGGFKDLTLYHIGLMYAFVIQEGLKRAHDAGNLTREGVKKALDTMIWDFKGMFDGKSFAYKSHTVPMLRLYQYKVKVVDMGGRKIPTGMGVPISNWMNTDQIKW
ncbi:MAG: ABC transporter substrate-binding protein [Deltaproteobacteria bacterium]|nr:ABC transporter substrate-binding protein [Deltaproteobacteria bacterium]MBW1816754.1 ABC transporter substrate-binding protein [Deltaproteobacteria bacterium]